MNPQAYFWILVLTLIYSSGIRCSEIVNVEIDRSSRTAAEVYDQIVVELKALQNEISTMRVEMKAAKGTERSFPHTYISFLFSTYCPTWISELYYSFVKPILEFLSSFYSVPLIYATKTYVDYILHDRRDYTDMMTISFHTFGRDAEGKITFFAPLEATINMKESFKDDPLLYAKVKMAIGTSHSNKGYPEFCVLVGKRTCWWQFYCYCVYCVLTWITSFAVLIVYFLENIISWIFSISSLRSRTFQKTVEIPVIALNLSKRVDDCCNHYISLMFSCDTLYTPDRDDNQLFKRRLKNIVSEQIKNSRWPFDSWSQSFNIQDALQSDSSRLSIGKEKVLLLPVCGKENDAEIKQLKIMLIFEEELKACRYYSKDQMKFELGYDFWKTRVKHLKEWSIILDFPLDPYKLGRYWTEIKVPEYPEVFFALQNQSKRNSQRAITPNSLPPVVPPTPPPPSASHAEILQSSQDYLRTVTGALDNAEDVENSSQSADVQSPSGMETRSRKAKSKFVKSK
jgi:hypothetical protein